MRSPKILKYTSDHLWVLKKGEHAYIGMTDYAQKQIGKIVLISTSLETEKISKNKEFGYVEGKNGAFLELIMPFTCELLRINIGLVNNPARINASPYMAWIACFKIIPNAEEKNTLLTEAAYKKLIDKKTEEK